MYFCLLLLFFLVKTLCLTLISFLKPLRPRTCATIPDTAKKTWTNVRNWCWTTSANLPNTKLSSRNTLAKNSWRLVFLSRTGWNVAMLLLPLPHRKLRLKSITNTTPSPLSFFSSSLSLLVKMSLCITLPSTSFYTHHVFLFLLSVFSPLSSLHVI